MKKKSTKATRSPLKNLPVRGKKAAGVKGGMTTADPKLSAPPDPDRSWIAPPEPDKRY